MRSPPRTFLQRPPWLHRRRAPHGKSLPGLKPWLSCLKAARNTDLEHHLQRETGQPWSIDTPQARLDRALALQMTGVLRAREDNLNIWCDCPPTKRHYLDKFNLYLWNASINPKDPFTAKELWRWYIKATVVFPTFLRALSTKAWNTVWRTQSLRTPAEPKVVAHLNQLVDDMQKAGYKPSYEHRFIHMETMFGRGYQTKALAQWENRYKTDRGRTEDSYRSDYLKLGIRMYSAAGMASEAQKHLIDLFTTYPESDPRLVLSVFDAHIRSGQPVHTQQAWAIYLFLKERLGHDLTLDDYERCYLGFLQSGHRDHALTVFRDMMLAPELRDFGRYSDNAKVLRGLNDLNVVLESAEQLNEVFLSGISTLPRKHQNHFFFSKWLKRLIERDHLDAAAQVFELMFERGIQPRARDINRLIGAWLHTGNPDNIQKAETLGLQMVLERIALVQRRNRKESRPPYKLDKLFHNRPKLFLRRTLPAATSETFGVLVQICLKDGDEQKLQDLHTWQVVQAELPISTPAMKTQMALQLQRGHLDGVWRIYKRAVLRRPTQRVAATIPDIGTFAYLWEAARQKPRLRGRPVHQRGGSQTFPPPAIILREHLRWLQPTTTDHLSHPRIPHRILATFTAHNDLPGALVAAHALHHRLALPPTPQTANILALAVARLNFPHPSNTPRQRRRINASASLSRNLSQVLRLLRALLERRLHPYQERAAAAAAQRGGPDADQELDERERAGLLLDALSELVRAALVRSGWQPAKVEATVKGVKNAIRVPEGMPTGDRTAFEVV